MNVTLATRLLRLQQSLHGGGNQHRSNLNVHLEYIWVKKVTGGKAKDPLANQILWPGTTETSTINGISTMSKTFAVPVQNSSPIYKCLLGQCLHFMVRFLPSRANRTSQQ